MESQGYAASASERPISEGVGLEEPHQHAQVLEPPTSAVYGSDRMNGGSGYAGPPPLPEGWWKTGGETFLLVTFVLGLIAWLTSLVATAVVAATINGPSVRILWFAVIIQTYTTFLVLQVLINPEPHPYTAADDIYGTQIALLATLACVFAVIGVDGNIYSGISSQQAAGAGWLLVAITDLLWILYFTSPVDAPFARFVRGVGRGFGGGGGGGDAAGVGESGGGGGALGMGSAGFTFGFGRRGNRGDRETGTKVQKISRSTEAFIGGPMNTNSNSQYGTQSVEMTHVGHEVQQHPPSSGRQSMLQKKRRSASGRWSSHTPGSGRDSHPNPNTNVPLNTNANANATATATTNPNPNPNFNTLSTTRETVLSKGEGTLRPESGSTGTGTQIPFGGTAATQREGVAPPMSPAPIPEESKDALRLDPDAKWRAQALFEYKGSKEDPQELVFKKGEILLIYDKSGKWWEAKNAEGRKGIVPSNYLRLL